MSIRSTLLNAIAFLRKVFTSADRPGTNREFDWFTPNDSRSTTAGDDLNDSAEGAGVRTPSVEELEMWFSLNAPQQNRWNRWGQIDNNRDGAGR